MGVVKIQTKLRTVIIRATSHYINPHRRLSIDMVADPANALKDRRKPIFIRKNAFVKILDNPHNRVLTEHRIQLPKLDRLGAVL